MPEKNMTYCAILAARNKASGQSLRLQWRTFAADIMAVRLQKTVHPTQRCTPLSPGFIRDLLDFAGLSSNLAYITSVFIGYIVTARLVRLSNASLLKKPE